MSSKVNWYKGQPIRYKVKDRFKYAVVKDVGAVIGCSDGTKLIQGLDPIYFFKDKVQSLNDQKLQEVWMGTVLGILAILEKRVPGGFKGFRTWLKTRGFLPVPGQTEEPAAVAPATINTAAELPVAAEPLPPATPDISDQLAEIKGMCEQILSILKPSISSVSTYSFKEEPDEPEGIG